MFCEIGESNTLLAGKSESLNRYNEIQSDPISNVNIGLICRAENFLQNTYHRSSTIDFIKAKFILLSLIKHVS